MGKCSLLQQGVRVTLLFLLFLNIPSGSAEPASSVRWLMDQPTSLFDLGMLRLRQRNKEEWTSELNMKSKDKGLLLEDAGVNSVVYDSDKNIITILAAFSAPYIEGVDEKFCASILVEYKNIIARYKKDIPAGFDHIGYPDHSRPKNLDENINKILVFTVRLSQPRVLGGKTMSCSTGMDWEKPTFQKNF
jgi:hypothetical protein